MVKGLNIPDEFQYTFKRLINLVPYKQRNDRHTQKIVLLYLKLGGEKLARQYVEVLKSDLRENKDRTETSEKSNHEGQLLSDPNFPEDEDEDSEDEDEDSEDED
ncbi:MAG: hypothetical protein OEL58_04045 [Desulfobacteraceae bacterium]|nr:hypothetical protein [Desulfobacteraceae bacterium]